MKRTKSCWKGAERGAGRNNGTSVVEGGVTGGLMSRGFALQRLAVGGARLEGRCRSVSVALAQHRMKKASLFADLLAGAISIGLTSPGRCCYALDSCDKSKRVKSPTDPAAQSRHNNRAMGPSRLQQLLMNAGRGGAPQQDGACVTWFASHPPSFVGLRYDQPRPTYPPREGHHVTRQELERHR